MSVLGGSGGRRVKQRLQIRKLPLVQLSGGCLKSDRGIRLGAAVSACSQAGKVEAAGSSYGREEAVDGLRWLRAEAEDTATPGAQLGFVLLTEPGGLTVHHPSKIGLREHPLHRVAVRLVY